MLILYAVQALVPISLIAWLALAAPRSTAGFWTQTGAIAIALAAISLTGIWSFPPWWTPYVFGVLLILAVLAGLFRHQRASFWPEKLSAWFSLAGFAVLALYGANEVRVAVSGRNMPPGRFVELSSPLGPGVYLVANGGARLSVNAHAEFLDQGIPRHRPYWGTAHGVDLVALDRWGLRADGILPSDPARYKIFGRAVVAPCAGDVVTAVDGLPDMDVPHTDHDHLAGNHVILRCGEAEILLGHFRQGSLAVQAGQTLRPGDAIAEVGNSGNSSEPHLHLNAQEPGTPDAPFSGAPIPVRINGRYLARNDRLHVRRSGTPAR
jgi:Peptidase family M23